MDLREAREALRDSGRELKHETRELMDEARDKAREYKHRVAERARDAAGAGMGRAAECLRHVSEAIGKASEALRERDDDAIASYADEARSPIDRLADYLESSEPKHIAEDACRYVRRHPGATISGLFLVGFAASRFLKATDEPRSDSRHTGGDRRSQARSSSTQEQFAYAGQSSKASSCASDVEQGGKQEA